MPISTLQSPSSEYQVQEVKEWYIDYLVDLLNNEDDDHENLTAPLLVIASVSATDFQQLQVESYTYQVSIDTLLQHKGIDCSSFLMV